MNITVLAQQLFGQHKVFKVSAQEKAALSEMFGGQRFPFYEQHLAYESVTGKHLTEASNVQIVLSEHLAHTSTPDDDDVLQGLSKVFPNATEDEHKDLIRLLAKRFAVVKEARGLPSSNYKVEALPAGVLAQLRYRESQQADRPNRNRHIYQYDSMATATRVADERAKRGELFYLAGHPAICEIPTARKIAGVIREVGFDKTRGIVPLHLDVMEGEQGRAIATLLRIAAAVPISSRAWGDFEVVYHYEGKFGEFGKAVDTEDEAEDAETFMLIKDFEFEGWDFVAGSQGVRNAVILPTQRGAATTHPQESTQRRYIVTSAQPSSSTRGASDMDQNQKYIDRLEADVKAREASLHALRTELATKTASLLEEVSQAKVATKYESENNARLRTQHDELLTRHDDLRAKFDGIREEFAESKVTVSELTARLKQLDEAKATIDDLKTKVEEHRSAAKTLTQEHAAKVEELRSAARTLAQEHAAKVEELAREHADAIKAKDTSIAELQRKITPPEPDEETKRMMEEKAKLAEEKARLDEDTRKMRQALHANAMSTAIDKRLGEGKFREFKDLVKPLVISAEAGNVPEDEEKALKACENAEGFLTQVLEKARSTIFNQQGPAQGQGAPEGVAPSTPPATAASTTPPTQGQSYIEKLAEEAGKGAPKERAPKKGARSRVGAKMLGAI